MTRLSNTQFLLLPKRMPEERDDMAHTLDTLLRLLHPMVPFVTEEVWQLLADAAPCRGLDSLQPAAESIMVCRGPAAHTVCCDERIESQFARFQEVLRAVAIRGRQNVPPKTQIEFSVCCDTETAVLGAADGILFPFDGRGGRPAGGPEVEAPVFERQCGPLGHGSSSIWPTSSTWPPRSAQEAGVGEARWLHRREAEEARKRGVC